MADLMLQYKTPDSKVINNERFKFDAALDLTVATPVQGTLTASGARAPRVVAKHAHWTSSL